MTWSDFRGVFSTSPTEYIKILEEFSREFLATLCAVLLLYKGNRIRSSFFLISKPSRGLWRNHLKSNACLNLKVGKKLSLSRELQVWSHLQHEVEAGESVRNPKSALRGKRYFKTRSRSRELNASSWKHQSSKNFLAHFFPSLHLLVPRLPIWGQEKDLLREKMREMWWVSAQNKANTEVGLWLLKSMTSCISMI